MCVLACVRPSVRARALVTKLIIKHIQFQVDVIFHGAATVRFDEALKLAVHINVRGTKEILLLAKSCTKLRAFVHISTAYSNCVRKQIREEFYDSPIPADKIIDLVDTLDDKVLEDIKNGLLSDFPNTYAYTKAVAEDVVRQYSKGLPVAMIRPAIESELKTGRRAESRTGLGSESKAKLELKLKRSLGSENKRRDEIKISVTGIGIKMETGIEIDIDRYKGQKN
ncbi:Fatty acyl-CoA reductase 2 [Eumeta japonica]|uniref:Fatty acyl-CoA reductase n=1 Tax=Eumeta variegata TaxID=151549 RepID=A0A4C1Z620_EUMVA|nr:Fatty acyl-CoA reductase 2 [Eumeta japonica]